MGGMGESENRVPATEKLSKVVSVPETAEAVKRLTGAG
jgi:hypothetical protein